MAKSKNEARKRRKRSIRRKVSGTAERPRLTVYRSLKHIYAQVIDDETRQVLTEASTLGKAKREQLAGQKKKEQARKVGTALAEKCKAKGIAQVVFDRNGYKYHGRVLELATGAREGGLQF